MTGVRALQATLRFTDGRTTSVSGDDAHRLYLGHNFAPGMGDKRLRVIGGRDEFERALQRRTLEWLERRERPSRPRVLIVGDSIRMRISDCSGYGLYAYKLLASSWNISHIPHNTGGSKTVCVFIDDWLGCRPDVVHLHVGLHDLATTPWGKGPEHVSPETYRANLRYIIERIRSTPSVKHLIWGRITPVVEALHNMENRILRRLQSDVDLYNEVADEVMAAERVESNDIAAPLHAMGVANGLLIDGVHLNPAAAAILGRQVAERVNAARPS
jgi:hypothetical protein